VKREAVKNVVAGLYSVNFRNHKVCGYKNNPYPIPTEQKSSRAVEQQNSRAVEQ